MRDIDQTHHTPQCGKHCLDYPLQVPLYYVRLSRANRYDRPAEWGACPNRSLNRA
jgi:hypothetical protein